MSRTAPLLPCAIVWIRQATPIQRQAATTDALGEAGPQPLEFGQPRIDPLRPRAGKPGPLRPLRDIAREFGQFRSDFVERQADVLGKDDERNATNHGPMVSAMASRGPLRANKSSRLVEPERRRGDPGPPRHLSNR